LFILGALFLLGYSLIFVAAAVLAGRWRERFPRTSTRG